MLPKDFFISGFTVNSESLNDYSPLIITEKSPYIQLHGLLTSYFSRIYHGEKEILPKNIDLIIKANLMVSGDFSNTSQDPEQIQLLRYPLDAKLASVKNFPSLQHPALFSVKLNPFRQPPLDFKTLPASQYFFEILISIDLHNGGCVKNIFQINLPGKFKFSKDGDVHA